MAGVQRLEHVECLATAHLTDDQPVGPHAQRTPNQLAHADRARAFGVGGPRLEAHHVRLFEPELGRLLDRHDAFGGIDRPRERVATRRLPHAGGARHDDVPTTAHHRVQEDASRRVESERVERHTPRVEAPNRDARTVRRQRWQHGMQARPVGEAGVDHRRGAVEAQPQRCDDPFDDAHDRGRVDVAWNRDEPPRALDVDAPGPVDEHFGHVGVGEQWLERTEPADVVDQLVEHQVGFLRGQQRRLLTQHPGQLRAQLLAIERARVEARFEQATMQRVPQRGRHAARSPGTQPMRVSACWSGRANASGMRAAEHPRVDGPRRRRARLDAREYRYAQHVFDIAGAERAPVLVDEHDPGRELDRLVAHGAPQGQVAASHDDDIDVGDLREHDERGRVEPARVAQRGSRVGTERDRERGAGLGCDRADAVRARGQQRQSGADVDREMVERLGRRGGAGLQPITQAGRGIVGPAEHRGLVAREIGNARRRAPRDEQSRRRSDDRRSRAALRRPEADEHEVPPRSTRERASPPGKARGRSAAHLRGYRTRDQPSYQSRGSTQPISPPRV